MFHVLRLMAFALLVVALPLRGYAAAAMLFCGGAHGMPAGAAVHGHHAETPSTMPDAHGGHDAMDHHAMNVDHTTSSTDDTGSATDGTDSSGCGVCGDCCAGVATSPTLAILADRAPSASPIPFAPPLYRGADLAHAERPPLA
jgi:hypothetical protein